MMHLGDDAFGAFGRSIMMVSTSTMRHSELLSFGRVPIILCICIAAHCLYVCGMEVDDLINDISFETVLFT